MKYIERAAGKRFIFCLTIGLSFAGFADDAATDTEPELAITSGKVTEIIDGDTFKYCPTENEPCTEDQWVEVDLWGVDAPELAPKEQFFAKKASQYLVDELLRQTVILEQISVDDDGKPKVKVLIVNHPDSNFNVHLLIKGHGWSTVTDDDDATDVVAYREAQEFASERKLGLWREIEPVTPWDWLQQQEETPESPTDADEAQSE